VVYHWQKSERKSLYSEVVEMPLLCNAVYVGKSKMCFYEIPYTIKGSIKHTGSKDNLKVYVKIELSERGKVETQSDNTQ